MVLADLKPSNAPQRAAKPIIPTPAVVRARKFKNNRERKQRKMVKAQRVAEQNDRIVGVDDSDPTTWGKSPRQAPALIDPLRRMNDSGELDDAGLKSAHQIEQAHRIITRGVHIRIGNMEPRVDNGGGGDATDHEMDILRVYYAWTKAMHENGNSADPILDICVAGQTITATARQYRMHHKTISKMLKDALRLHWEVKKGLGREKVTRQRGPREVAC